MTEEITEEKIEDTRELPNHAHCLRCGGVDIGFSRQKICEKCVKKSQDKETIIVAQPSGPAQTLG